ncbi:hypothetical protein [Tissierella sp.]
MRAEATGTIMGDKIAYLGNLYNFSAIIRLKNNESMVTIETL